MSFANVVSQVVSLVGVRNKQSVWDADMERVSNPKCLKMTCSRLNRCRFSEFSGGGSLCLSECDCRDLQIGVETCLKVSKIRKSASENGENTYCKPCARQCAT